MRIRRRGQVKITVGLMLTPMLDMLTVVLIFLILNFSPEKSAITTSQNLKLPKSEMQIAEVPKVKLEVTPDAIILNGSAVAGLSPTSTDSEAWSTLKTRLNEMSSGNTNEPVLLMADRVTDYDHVDRTVARLASMGYSDIYLLTELEDAK